MAATTPFNPFGLSPYSGVSVNPFLLPQVTTPYATQPLQQIQQLLQIIPYQIQQWQQLVSAQQYQLQQLQQVLHLLPAQLSQLQSFAPAGISALPLWSTSPQAFGAQPSHVM